MKYRLFWLSALGMAVLSIILVQRRACSHWTSFHAMQSARPMEPAEIPPSAPEVANSPPTTASAYPGPIPAHQDQLCHGVRLLDIEPAADGRQSGAWLSLDPVGLQLVPVGGTLGKFTLTRVYEKAGAAQAWLNSPEGACRVMLQTSEGPHLAASRATASFAQASRMNTAAIASTAPTESLMADADRARMRLVNQVLKQSLSK